MMKKNCVISFVLSIFIIIPLLTSCFKYNHPTAENPELPATTAVVVNDLNSEEGLNESAQFFIENKIIMENEYKADTYVSRIVAVRIISDITGLEKETENSSYTHPYIDISDETQKLIGFLYHNNIIEGVTNNNFMEDEICNIDTFLVFLMRALDFIGGQQNEYNTQNIRELAINKGIMSSESFGDNVFSVNDAFTLCHNALYIYINDDDTLLTYLNEKGFIQVSNKIDSNQAYEIIAPQITPFFEETFDDKKISGNTIKGDKGVVWQKNNVSGTDNSITDSGRLQMSGNLQELVEDQQYALSKDLMQGNESFGMTFTVNVNRMGNEGDESRVTFRVIPRTADENFSKYYAINYFMVMPLEGYQSNLVRCKWSITNTNAPSGAQPLTQAYYLLKENVDYTARVLIENTDDGNVHIAFYIDGADHYKTEVEPLLEYTDSSKYKITNCAAGPAFGISGYQDSGWGFAPTVCFDDIKLFDAQSFALQTQQLKEYTNTAIALLENDEYANQFRYLVNHGIMKPNQLAENDDDNVSIEQFLASAMYLNEQHLYEGQSLGEFVLPTYQKLFKGTKAEKNLDLSRAITRYESALIIKEMMPGIPASDKYKALYNDKLEEDYLDTIYFAVQNSYLIMDENNNFNGGALLTRREMLNVFFCAVDERLRDKNHTLQFSSIFSNDAILQGGKAVPISGLGMSGDTVTVEFNGQKKTAQVVDGKWNVELDSMPYGGPYNLVIKDTGYSYTLKRLYVGEVFIVAGQSNSEMSVYECDDNTDTLKMFNNSSRLRLFRPISSIATTPLFDTTTKWEVPDNPYSEYIIGTASAIGVFCIQKLIEINPLLKDVKIGIIQLAYGGTSIELFLPDSVNVKNNFVQADDEFIVPGFWHGYMDATTPYAAKAMIYYQGENSTQLCYQYEPLLRDYIWGVREEFNDASLPVMLVQLSGYGDNYGQDNDSWAKVREIQMRIANTTDHVGLVTAIDLADEDPMNIHPTAKRPIGDRLAYLAMNMIYGQDYGKQSAKLLDYKLDGNVYRLKFSAKELDINQKAFGDIAFEVLNSEGKWVPAQAKIEGNTLLVYNDRTIVPQGVRYAWANYPKACLFDEQGLPVLPFNTTKDLNKVVTNDDFTTNEHYLKKAYHLLDNNDAVINLSRDNEFRYVTVIDSNMVEYRDNDIIGQSPGDKIALLKKQDNNICERETTDTIIKIKSHSLKVGDWVRNLKYDVFTQILEVIDEDTVRVASVAGQSNGNVFEVFKNIGTITAEE